MQESKLVDIGRILVGVRLNQALNILNDAVHVGRH
jgi:hypothetical protein